MNRRHTAARLRREARYLLWGWTILVCAAGTLGGLLGCVELHRESTTT